MKDIKGKYIQTSFNNPEIGHIRMMDYAGKNCLSHAFVHELTDQIQALRSNEIIKVVILSGLPEVFCGGADLETLKLLAKGEIKPIDILLSKLILDIQVPVISIMEGHAVGGGLALGLCADIALLAEESRYGCSFMNLGFTPGMGTTKLLEHYMSPAIAHEMLYTGINYKGAELKGKTNFNHIRPKAELFALGLELAEAIIEKPIHALKALKRYLSIERRKLFEETYSIESIMHELTFNKNDIHQSIENNYVR
jgi:polyketide biosynthesis enoyl-CoA hydratase PksI